MSKFDIRGAISAARAAGLADDRIGYVFELTAGELGRIEAGDLAGWDAKATPAYRQRVKARVGAMAQAHERQADDAAGEAASFERVHALMERAGVPDDMTVGDALDAGLITEIEVEQATDPRAD